MTYEERKQQVCKDCCYRRIACAYLSRELEDKCTYLQDVMEGWELGQEDTLKSLWHDAQGEDLPEYGVEVIAFQGRKVVIAHRPNPKGWNARNLSTDEVKHYTPMTYDKGGWNMPDVKYWLDAPLPEGIE